LKSTRCQEAVTLEEKYQEVREYTFEGNILLYGNSDFEAPEGGNNDTTGIVWRFIKFPCNTVPKVANSKLVTQLKNNKL